MNILIVRLSSIGDIIHTLPAVPLLKDYYPESILTWVTGSAGAELLTGYQGIDRIIVFPDADIHAYWHNRRVLRVVGTVADFVKKIRQQHYDLVLDFQGLLKSGLIVCASRSKYKIGLSNAREGACLFYDHSVPPAAFDAHGIQRNVALLSALGIDPQPVLFSALFNEDDVRAL
ncbi:MAG: hypothetical protein N3B18_09720, partial [Desulfobacterota bacterium]|nr:hypothetical protein [Thermodesulfobacteriota bacterium]